MHPIRFRIKNGPEILISAENLEDSLLGASIGKNARWCADWLTNSQHVKPGNQMPDIRLPAKDMRSLLAYLESLR